MLENFFKQLLTHGYEFTVKSEGFKKQLRLIGHVVPVERCL